MDVDWDSLRAEARDAASRAYAPYSGLSVGAAGLTAAAGVVSACNVENASYGLTLCAECGLVSALHATGGRRLLAVSVVALDGEPLSPCGRCRQLLHEAGGDELLVDAGKDREPARLGSLLPGAFQAADVEERRGGAA